MVGFAALLLGAAPSDLPEKWEAVVPPAEVARGKRGVVVSANRDASRAGVTVLKKGGNAVDAAIATAYALAVVEPFSAGVGGGGFMLFYSAKTKKTVVVDYREVAPKKAHRDMYVTKEGGNTTLSQEGILAVAVPGMVPGLAEAQRRFGKKKLKDVLGPAITLAAEGFLVTPRFHVVSVARQEMLAANIGAREVFLRPDGSPYAVGERLVQKDLARALRAVKRRGPRVFTHGWVAKAMAKESKRLGGLLELSDLKRFKARIREPLVGTYRGHTVITMPPPSSGGVHLLQMLGMLEADHKQRGRKGSTEDAHYLIEIMRRAYADRATFLGDPGFVEVPIAGLLDNEYLLDRYRTINGTKATPSKDITAGKPSGLSRPKILKGARESKETTHLTVIDAEGNVVSLTQTVNTGFGSGVVVPKTGVLLNNEMDDFSVAPGVPNAFGLVGGEANSVQPGKIPLSSMTPTIVLKEGEVRLAVGAPGGSTIITTVLQIILRVIDEGKDVASAVASPRMHMQWLPDAVMVEAEVEAATMKALEAKGHRLLQREPWGNATAIEVLEDGTRIGAADPRGDGAGDAQ